MALPVEDTRLREAALAYVIELYDELTMENGAPTWARRTKPSISSSPIPNYAAASSDGPRPSISTKRRPSRRNACGATGFTTGSAPS